MNAPLRPAWLVQPVDASQPPGEPVSPAPPPTREAQATPAGERYLWNSRFGPIEVEVRDGQVYVNGEWVRPAEPQS